MSGVSSSSSQNLNKKIGSCSSRQMKLFLSPTCVFLIKVKRGRMQSTSLSRVAEVEGIVLLEGSLSSPELRPAFSNHAVCTGNASCLHPDHPAHCQLLHSLFLFLFFFFLPRKAYSSLLWPCRTQTGSYLPRGCVLLKVSKAEQEQLQGYLSDYFLRRAGVTLFTLVPRADVQLWSCCRK